MDRNKFPILDYISLLKRSKISLLEDWLEMGFKMAMVSLKGYDTWARTAAPARTWAGVS